MGITPLIHQIFNKKGVQLDSFLIFSSIYKESL
jgi:hypothetical protein